MVYLRPLASPAVIRSFLYLLALSRCVLTSSRASFWTTNDLRRYPGLAPFFGALSPLLGFVRLSDYFGTSFFPHRGFAYSSPKGRVVFFAVPFGSSFVFLTSAFFGRPRRLFLCFTASPFVFTDLDRFSSFKFADHGRLFSFSTTLSASHDVFPFSYGSWSSLLRSSFLRSYPLSLALAKELYPFWNFGRILGVTFLAPHGAPY